MGGLVLARNLWDEGRELFSGLVAGLTIAILALTLWVMKGLNEDLKKDLPLVDEMSRRTWERAGLYAFVTGLYFDVCLIFVSSVSSAESFGPRGNVHDILAASILAMSVSFFVYWTILRRKGCRVED